MRMIWFSVAVMCVFGFAHAQNLVPNPSFERGLTNPDGWRLNSGIGKWENFGRTGRRCISVTGNGNDSNAWECVDWKPENGKLYRIRFFVRRSSGSAGGTPITGFSTVNRDAWDVPSDDKWHLHEFVCRTPVKRSTEQGTGDTGVLRFGQWHVKGTVSYDDIEVLPVISVHKVVGSFVVRHEAQRSAVKGERHSTSFRGLLRTSDATPLTLRGLLQAGSGESIRNGIYRFATNFSGYSSNDSRPLFAHTAGFNTDRWVLGGPMSERWQERGAWVIYRHKLNGTGDEGRGTSEFRFETAKLAFVIGYYEGGQLVVEVSTDGKAWREIGRFSPSGEYIAEVPANLLPADEIWVRFWATGVLQVNAYRMEAKLTGNPPDAVGETWYFAVKRDTGQGEKSLVIEPKALVDRYFDIRRVGFLPDRIRQASRLVPRREGETPAELKTQHPDEIATNGALLVLIRNETTKQRQISVILRANNGSAKSVKVALKPKSEQIVAVPLPQLAAGEQVVTLTVREGATVVYEAEARVQKSWIEVGGFGYQIASTDALTLWWCEATYKIGRTTPRPPSRVTRPVRIESARNEYEPFQLVITPQVPIKQLRLQLEPFQAVEPVPDPKSPVPIWDEIALVDYVPVTIPTDAWGSQGEFPDPLIPLWKRDEGRGTGDEVTKIEVQVGNLQAGKNQPLWLTVFVPKGVPAGNYKANIRIFEAIGIDGKPVPSPKSPIPVELRVFGFTLPDDTPLRTAYGVHIDNDWHRLKTQEQFRQVWDLYMQTCRRYRISPYTPHAYAPIRWEAKGPRTAIDNGVLRLVIDRWQGRVASVTRDMGHRTIEKGQQLAPRPASLVPIGGVLPVLEQFEREGIGWEGKGIGWAGTEVVRDVKIVEQTGQRIVLDITAERVSSFPTNRKFAATVRLTVEAGKPYFSVQLRKIVNTDSVRWRINGYFHLLPPDQKPLSSVNTDRFGAWQIPVGTDDNPSVYFGAAGTGFTYSLRINPTTGHPHGDVYRQVGKWLEPNEVWEPTDEPIAFVFLWDGKASVSLREGEAPAEPQRLEKFVEQLLRGEIAALPESKLQLVEQPEPEFSYDFTEFDEAMHRYLDEFRFNGFNLVILPETLGGYERFTPEWTQLYKRLMAPIVEHLKQKGWLSKAYCYWVDEPSPNDYENVKRGMLVLKEAMPGVRRLLTFCFDKAPVPFFYDAVDLWVPVMSLFDEHRAKERQALGEEVWWYVCTGPKAPYPNNFIDHPAITHRIRYWMAAKWNLDGDLYWSMTYYRGKGWRLRNPYEDGQSETPEGGYWGNGDGRLLYPPVRQPLPENAEPVIAPPIPSIRLALIAEGIEDHCYFWMLKRLRDAGRGTRDGSKELQEALKLADEALRSLDRLIRSQTDYEHDPQKLHAERRKVAEAIERLTKLLGKP